MKRWTNHPAFWLIIQPVAVLAWLAWRGALVPQIVPDTASYDIQATSLPEWLSAIRPFAYPLFLKAASLFGDGYAAVPTLHYLLHAAAVWAFYWGLRQVGMRPLVGCCAASALFYSHSQLVWGSTVFSDPLAIAAAIASSGCWLAAAAQPRSAIRWSVAALLTFLTYQLQPAYLFVLALWPVLGVFFGYLLYPGQKRSLIVGALTTLAVVLPFLGFCALRLLVVGHFGLVSFGGYNVVGIAGQLIDEQDVPLLDSDLRPLARAIIDERQKRIGADSPQSFAVMEERFNPIVWDVAVPAARQLYANDIVQVNQQLAQLSRSVLQNHPAGYLRWLVWNTKHGVIQIVVLTAKDKAVLLAFGVLLVVHFVRGLRGPRENTLQAASVDRAVIFRESQILAWLAVGFAAGKLLLVVLVEPANDRYMTGAMVFIPACVAALAAGYVRGEGRGARR